jgi:hypothetical protein
MTIAMTWGFGWAMTTGAALYAALAIGVWRWEPFETG